MQNISPSKDFWTQIEVLKIKSVKFPNKCLSSFFDNITNGATKARCVWGILQVTQTMWLHWWKEGRGGSEFASPRCFSLKSNCISFQTSLYSNINISMVRITKILIMIDDLNERPRRISWAHGVHFLHAFTWCFRKFQLKVFLGFNSSFKECKLCLTPPESLNF